MSELNSLESAIFSSLAQKYPLINNHLPFLIVKNRKATGVGMYVDFDYSIPEPIVLNIENKAISNNEVIRMNGLVNGLQYEVNIEGGKLLYMELVTLGGEHWDGLIRSFVMEPFQN